MGGALLASRRQRGRTPSLCIWCVVGTSQSISCIGVVAFRKAGQAIRICRLRPRCCERTREDRAGRSSLVATGRPAIASAWTKIPLSDALLRTDAICRQWKRSGHRVHSAGARAVRLATKHDTPRSSLPVRSGPYVALVLLGGFWNWSHPTLPAKQVQIEGRLADWSLHNYGSRGGSHTTVHLRITGYNPEFRIDPGIFHDLMGNRLPAGFTDGATIEITADARELAAPVHPQLEPGIAIVWVDGLAVNGVTAFALSDVLQHERGQWTGWIALAVMATCYLAYRILKSRKKAGPPGRPS